MASPRTSLAAVWVKFINEHSKCYTCMAFVAVSPVSKHATTSKPFTDQPGVNGVVYGVAGCRYLRSSLLFWQIAAGIGRGCIKLQGLLRGVLELRHGCVGLNNICQYKESNCQTGAGCASPLVTCSLNIAREISHAPSEAR